MKAENNISFLQLIVEKESAERNRTELESRLNEARDKINTLESDITHKDEANRRLQQQLAELQGRFKLLTGQTPSTIVDVDEDVTGSGRFRASRSRQKMALGTSSSSGHIQDRFGSSPATKRRDDSGHYGEQLYNACIK